MLNWQFEHADYHKWINDVVDYARNNFQAEVELLADENAYIYSIDGGKINVKGGAHPRDKLYILLHEIGHLHRLSENNGDSTYFLDKSGDRNLREKTMTLMEEVLAWHKGEEIAKDLNIVIEHRAWQRLMNHSIEEYVQWINEGEKGESS